MQPRQTVTAHDAEAALRHNEIMTELQALRALLQAREGDVTRPDVALPKEANAFKSELSTIYDAVKRTKEEIALLLVTGFAGPGVGNVSHELKAVVGGTESATHDILNASEEIEENARNLVAAIKSVQDQGLARDILDQVTRIFEACNFQDVAGQRIGKVTNTLKFIEDHILQLMAIWGGMEQLADAIPAAKAEHTKHPHLVSGPTLDGNHGYVSQKEIDAMFARD